MRAGSLLSRDTGRQWLSEDVPVYWCVSIRREVTMGRIAYTVVQVLH